MTRSKHESNGAVLALSSAFLFGASIPVAKLLLRIADPVLLAGWLYLGSGAGLALVATGGRWLGLGRSEAPLRAGDLPWLGAIVLFGGILGPALLMWGLTARSTSCWRLPEGAVAGIRNGRRRQGCTDKGSRREVGANARGSQVPKPQHKEDQADPVAEEADCGRGASERPRPSQRPPVATSARPAPDPR